MPSSLPLRLIIEAGTLSPSTAWVITGVSNVAPAVRERAQTRVSVSFSGGGKGRGGQQARPPLEVRAREARAGAGSRATTVLDVVSSTLAARGRGHWQCQCRHVVQHSTLQFELTYSSSSRILR